jgi:hypothetical protein
MAILHSDQPFIEDESVPDLLDRGLFLNEVVKSIQTCNMPIVFGIHGDWGQGKTSFMLQAKKILEMGKSVDPCKVIWFEAWRYQNEPAPIIALLHEIRRALGIIAATKGRIEKLGNVTIRGALLSIEEVTKLIAFQASKIEQAGKEWEKTHLAEELSADQIGKLLDQAIEAILKTMPRSKRANPPRLVVMIDDLDRCERGAAFRLLEGLKLYLNLSSCVFILGMNKTIVEDSIAWEFSRDPKETKPECVRASAYMEKICQVIWHLPPIRKPEVYLLHLLRSMPPKHLKLLEDLLNTRDTLPPNPRRLKALANAVLLLWERHWGEEVLSSFPQEQGEGIQEMSALLVMAYLTQACPDLYHLWQFYGKDLFSYVWNWAIESNKEDTFSAEDSRALTSMNAQSAFEKASKHLQLPFGVRFTSSPDGASIPANKSKWFPHFRDPSDSTIFWAQPLFVEAVMRDNMDFENHSSRCARYL